MNSHLNVTSFKHILFAKSLFDSAEKISQERTAEISRFNSIIALHSATEILLNIMLTDALQMNNSTSNSNARNKWVDLFKSTKAEVSQAIGFSIPLFNELETLQRSRNQAMHRGVVPSSSTIEDGYNYVKQFFESCYSNCYGYELERVSMLEILSNRGVSKLLEDIRMLMDEEDWDWAAVGLAVCSGELGNSIQDRRNDIQRAFKRMPVTFALNSQVDVSTSLNKALEDYSKMLDSYFASVNQEILLSSLGMNALDTRRVWRVLDTLPHVSVVDVNKEQWHIMQSPVEQSPEDIEFLWSYMVDMAYRIQSSFPANFDEIIIKDRLLHFREVS